MSGYACLDIGRRNTRTYVAQDGASESVPDRGQWLLPPIPGSVSDWSHREPSPSCVAVESWGALAGRAAEVLAAHSSDVRALWLHSMPEDGATMIVVDGAQREVHPDFVIRMLTQRAVADYQAHCGAAPQGIITALRTSLSLRWKHAYAAAIASDFQHAVTFVDTSLAAFVGSPLYDGHERVAVVDVGFASSCAAIVRRTTEGPRLSVYATSEEICAASLRRAIAQVLTSLPLGAEMTAQQLAPLKSDVDEVTRAVLEDSTPIDSGWTTSGMPYALTREALQTLARSATVNILQLVRLAHARAERDAGEPTAILCCGTIFATPFGRQLSHMLQQEDRRWCANFDPSATVAKGMANLASDPALRAASSLKIDTLAGAPTTEPAMMTMTVNEPPADGKPW
jgi:hypothetical protein